MIKLFYFVNYYFININYLIHIILLIKTVLLIYLYMFYREGLIGRSMKQYMYYV